MTLFLSHSGVRAEVEREQHVLRLRLDNGRLLRRRSLQEQRQRLPGGNRYIVKISRLESIQFMSMTMLT